MIDRVRNTVLTLLNKENRGTITPAEFNRLVGLAQLFIFEENFYHYNRFINAQNQRQTNSEYSDIPKNIREKIDVFAKEEAMTFNVNTSIFNINNEDVYRVEQLFYKNKVIEEVPKSLITVLLEENYAPPSLTYPAYTRFGNDFKVYPETITEGVKAFYIRKPKTPKWTFININGNPVFNPSANDYQDLEIHPSDETMLIVKLLSYLGVSIREQEVYQYAETKEIQKNNKEQ